MNEKRAIVEVAWCPTDDGYGLMFKRQGDLKWSKAPIVENEAVKNLFEEEYQKRGEEEEWDTPLKKFGPWILIGILVLAIVGAVLW